MTSQSKVRDFVITGISTKFPYPNPYGTLTNEQNRFSQQSNGCFFDPHCPECIRELWGPLLSPFAYLIKQNAEYFNEIIMRIGQYKVNAKSNSSPKVSLEPPKLEYNDHKFLTTIGMCAFRTSKVGWLMTWTLGFLLLILAIAILVLKDSSVSPIIVILRMNEAAEWGMKITLQLMLASLLGLVGTAHRTQSIMLGTLIFLSILILFEIGAAIYCAIEWSELISDMEKALTNSFQRHYGGVDSDRITDAWDRIFQTYECCGWLSNDFTNTPWSPPALNTIPHSCCRPGASHPGCESIIAASAENYADRECSDAIRQTINSNAYVPIMFSAIGFLIFIEIASVVFTYLYSSTLKTASRRRRSHNERLLQSFQGRLASYTEETVNEKPPDLKQILPQQGQTEIDDLHQLYNQYTAFHQTPPNIDPSLMSITPTVIQVKRPNVYSYFYYE
ncbi:unnamed protein product [Rotaria sp. Silwood2]|nr:unnamed protein product [Rotaria sp. Silwood2]CAF3224016.1 unnamed protein product [Rotaria sp. Silwood2]CAF3869219.1 unnamed protein product [Rotaria sp. Silwood2]CAF4032627.1 unnamed protein product [Rotaria sp. Silwood2]CAF4057604.1 unnamed protein product [Rotaria sp. Silwood2]